jgi:uncharacterized protein (TIGR03435 family)
LSQNATTHRYSSERNPENPNIRALLQASPSNRKQENRKMIVATIPHDATEAQVPELLQTLLAERFKLTLHHETKDLPVYALVVGKSGPKLKPVGQEEGFKMMASPKGRHLEGNAQIAQLCDALSRTLDRPVVDMGATQSACRCSRRRSCGEGFGRELTY